MFVLRDGGSSGGPTTTCQLCHRRERLSLGSGSCEGRARSPVVEGLLGIRATERSMFSPLQGEVGTFEPFTLK